MEGGPRRRGARQGGPKGGAAGTHGTHTCEWALSKFEQLQKQDALHSWQTFLLLGWVDSSLGTYQCHLRLVAVERRFWHDAAGRVLEQALLESTRLGKFESTLKGIISAATMAVEIRLADVSIPTAIWRSVNAAKKMRTAAKERIWGSPVMLLYMAAKANGRDGWAVVGLAIVSFQLFLQVGEATSLQPWAVVDGAVRFFVSKTRQAWQQRSLTTLTREWLQWLARYFLELAAEGAWAWTKQQLEKGMQRLLNESPLREHVGMRGGGQGPGQCGPQVP